VKSGFPFDISHVRTIKYENTASGGKELEQQLNNTIEFVRSKAIPQEHNILSIESIKDNKLEDILKINQSQYELRRNRVHYFTYHTLHNFRDSIFAYSCIK